MKDFCIQKSSHAPKYVINTHGHWDHFWGNQVFEGATIIGHKGMAKDCADDLLKKIDVSKYIDHRPRLGWIMAVNGMHGAMKKK